MISEMEEFLLKMKEMTVEELENKVISLIKNKEELEEEVSELETKISDLEYDLNGKDDEIRELENSGGGSEETVDDLLCKDWEMYHHVLTMFLGNSDKITPEDHRVKDEFMLMIRNFRAYLEYR
jgi:predicted RNase H-like nuclease (RuvC/YqgF family)